MPPASRPCVPKQSNPRSSPRATIPTAATTIAPRSSAAPTRSRNVAEGWHLSRPVGRPFLSSYLGQAAFSVKPSCRASAVPVPTAPYFQIPRANLLCVADCSLSASNDQGDSEGQWSMTNRRALICACGLLLSVLAFRVFYIQELFFVFLFFALAYLLLLLVVAVVFCLLHLYARGTTYLAVRISEQGHHALPLLRVLVLWFAPTVTETAQVLSVRHRILFYPFYGLFRFHPLFSALRFTRNSHFYPVDRPIRCAYTAIKPGHAFQLELPRRKPLTLNRAFDWDMRGVGRFPFWTVNGLRDGRDDSERTAYKRGKATRRPFSRRCSRRGQVARGWRQEHKRNR